MNAMDGLASTGVTAGMAAAISAAKNFTDPLRVQEISSLRRNGGNMRAIPFPARTGTKIALKFPAVTTWDLSRFLR